MRERMRSGAALAAVLVAFLVALIAVPQGAFCDEIGTELPKRRSDVVPTESGYFFDTSISPGGAYHDAEAVDFGGCAFIVCIENASATLSVLVDFVPCGTSVAASDLVTPTSDNGMSTVQIVLPVSTTAPVPCFPGWYAGLIWQGQTDAASARVRILR